MAVPAGYVVKETASNVRRNAFTTIGAIVTVAVSLVLLGFVLLSRQAVHKQTARWRGGVELSVFMKPDASQSQIDGVKAQLDGTPGVKKVTFVDKPAALKEMKELFADQPNVVDTLTEDSAPPSYRVVPTRAELTEPIGQKFDNQPGVREVVYAKEAIRNIVKNTNQKNRVMLIFAGVMLGSAILLILVSIQQAIFARRREIEVMKRVGATNWFIRVPFMLEGLLQGVVGSILAFVAVYLGRNVAIALGTDPAFGSSISHLFVTGSEVVSTGVLMMVIGAIVGAFGSAFAVRRFLDV